MTANGSLLAVLNGKPIHLIPLSPDSSGFPRDTTGTDGSLHSTRLPFSHPVNAPQQAGAPRQQLPLTVHEGCRPPTPSHAHTNAAVEHGSHPRIHPGQTIQADHVHPPTGTISKGSLRHRFRLRVMAQRDNGLQEHSSMPPLHSAMGLSYPTHRPGVQSQEPETGRATTSSHNHPVARTPRRQAQT